MIRDMKRADADRIFEFLQKYFPEEEAILGTRPEGFEKVVRRLFRFDTRLLLGLLRLFGRPVFRFFVVEEDGRVVATTLLSFPERAGYLSMVVVDPGYRRRGHAQALLQRSLVATQATGRKYVALDVLANNTPARALYERVGYRSLRETNLVVREANAPLSGAPSPVVRPFRKEDAKPLVEVAMRARPPEVAEVLPVRESALRPGTFVDGLLQSESVAWVIDRGRGPEGYLGAASGAITTAAHFSDPIIAEGVEGPEAAALIRTGIDWCIGRGAPRIIAQVPVANVRGRAALLGGGFHDALSIWTLYRPIG
ncbi:MAG TPA: GNAT family N-acetyltransferase [Thermoplasmata archaeon]|nr:GNAT family N-acetyltransferase [Thermoplasmata archaeon]